MPTGTDDYDDFYDQNGPEKTDLNGNHQKEIPHNEAQKASANTAHRYPNDQTADNVGNQRKSVMNGNDEVFDNNVEMAKRNVSKKEKGTLKGSSIITGLMEQYLSNEFGEGPPPIKPKPSRSHSLDMTTENPDELANNMKNLEVSGPKKQAPPPVRHKPPRGHASWSDPRNQQRPKSKEAAWPPRGEPRDQGAYIVESYGQTDPYSNKLIKDIQKAKREEEERRASDKRSEIVDENIKPVSSLRSTLEHKPAKPRPGMVRPEANVNEERSWIRHEKKPMTFDTPPDEPDWMKLIRNRRWNSTVKARFPCSARDRTEFERRSTTPKNWKRLAQDKNALKMLSEVVGIGAEGEELFMRLASQRQKMEDEQEKLDRKAEEELMAYQVARESLGEDAAYSLQMDNPLPAARMVHLGPQPIVDGMDGISEAEEYPGVPSIDEDSANATSAYPFTTSQLEAAYLTNQLLRLHPEEFKKLMSLERSRQATLRWQFSADPFDSVHEHQTLPYEIAMLATQEPKVQQAMRKIVSQHDGENYFSSVFNSKPRSRMARSEGYASHASRYESDGEGYDSSTSAGYIQASRGRRPKKPPVPAPKGGRGRSVSPGMNGPKNQEFLKLPADDGTRETQAHGLFNDDDLHGATDDVAKLDQLTSNLTRNIDVELAKIESSLDDRKRGFFEEALRTEGAGPNKSSSDVNDLVNKDEIASRRKDFVEKDIKASSASSGQAGDIPKQRHKVRRISSDAQLNAVFGKRRQASESQSEEGEGYVQNGTDDGHAHEELNNLAQTITNTFGQ